MRNRPLSKMNLWFAIAAAATLAACSGDTTGGGASGSSSGAGGTTGAGSGSTSGTFVTSGSTSGTFVTSGSTSGSFSLASSGASSGAGGSGMGSGSASGASSGMKGDGGAAVTFAQVYSMIIMPRCAGCHAPGGAGGTMGKLDMSSQATAYTNLVGVAAMGTPCMGMGMRVVAGNAAMSILYTKVAAANVMTCGPKMPRTGAALTPAQRTMIMDWINGGAKM